MSATDIRQLQRISAQVEALTSTWHEVEQRCALLEIKNGQLEKQLAEQALVITQHTEELERWAWRVWTALEILILLILLASAYYISAKTEAVSMDPLIQEA